MFIRLSVIVFWLKKNDKCPLCRTTVKDVDFENLNIREDLASSKSRIIALRAHRARIRALRARSRR